jgi:hypothetical protein
MPEQAREPLAKKKKDPPSPEEDGAPAEDFLL